MPTPAIREAILRHWREAVPNDRLAHLVKDATRALLRALQMRLTAHDVSLGHWTFLRILWEKDGLTQRELSDQAGVMEPTTFSALNAMEKLGYVVRRQVPENRKKVFVHLTPKGRLLKEKLVPLAEEVNRIAVAGVHAGTHRRHARDAARHHRKPRARRCAIAGSGTPHPFDPRTRLARRRKSCEQEQTQARLEPVRF